MEQITIITRQAGAYYTALAYIGSALAGSATVNDKALAEAQAHAYATSLLQAGLLPEPKAPGAARLGGSAAVPTFGFKVRTGNQLQQLVRLAAQLAALDATAPELAPAAEPAQLAA